MPQASLAVNVLVTIRWNPVVQSAVLSVEPVMVTVAAPHASDAVGLITVGIASLQLISTLAGVLVNTGARLSVDHVIVLDAVAVLPQASLAVNVLVCEREQLLLEILPSLEVMVVFPQASVAVAEPSAALISAADGLQPRVVVVPPLDITGAVRSSLAHVIVLDAVAVLPQASLAVHVLVCEREHPLLVTLPSFEVIVVLPQASVADAVPSAALISAAVGLQPSVVVVPPVVTTGAVLSGVQVIVLDAVAVLPQASLAVNVLVCEREHVLLVILPSLEVIVVLPQASVAVAEPSAALISAVDGLQPNVVVVPLLDITGAVRSSLAHVIVLDTVAVLPQASLAVHVLV